MDRVLAGIIGDWFHEKVSSKLVETYVVKEKICCNRSVSEGCSIDDHRTPRNTHPNSCSHDFEAGRYCLLAVRSCRKIGRMAIEIEELVKREKRGKRRAPRLSMLVKLVQKVTPATVSEPSTVTTVTFHAS
ncbi:hypothetical protein L6452_08194 [Arctium lappa]|uniref:Uncharacterized protein n=1 Tax=Arctium lappa TaxID=4217 RepID=A0ACB9DGY4_ARCLA|nr:hypothetical protein L6452_08194 [Arctium lappa]